MSATALPEIDRTKTIGGSDVAAILGISPFRTRLDVWREKLLGQRDAIDTPGTRAGTRFEPHVLAAYAAQLPAGSVVEKPEPTIRGHLRASPDGIATVGGWRRLVEVKTTVFAQDWGAADSDEVPLHYAVQGMWYMELLELEEADFPVLLWPYEMRDLLGLSPAEVVAACELRTLHLSYSPSMARMLRDRTQEFWERHVLAEAPPPAVDLEDAKRLVWTVRGKALPADEELIRLLMQRDELKAAAKQLEQQIEANEFALRQRVGDAEAVVHPTTRQPLVTLNVTERAAYVANVKATSFRTIRTTKHWKEMQK
jgi:putative phage-type endonuclease